jgi:hypothetical protein
VRNPQILKRKGREKRIRFFLPVGGDYEQFHVARKPPDTPFFSVCIDTANRKTGRGIRRCRIPLGRAHDTLQPQDESIIVGYYTSAEVLPRKLPHPAQSEIRR